ncbi:MULTISPECIES: MBL fold metallo-hydrolase [unclassified Microbacterium]|uniref:MBL fold metallo-hydrolase n=1 Tax=unclassified Microbacterium TaxID=2609290 RepID=UPI00386C1D0B
MRITKHEHACLRIDSEGKTLLIDPGAFTLPLENLTDVIAVVLTHEHPDHWTPTHLEQIREMAPDAVIFGPEGVAAAASDIDVTTVAPGDDVTVGPFSLSFFGGTHAVIHESLPAMDNVGVLVNGEFYYPGDSYAVPAGVEVGLLATPVGAPWLKIGEAIDFVLAVAPRRAFGTHDMTLSQIGLGMHRDRLRWATEQGGGEFIELAAGESTDL